MEWVPRYTVKKAPGVGGDPIPYDEPCLVIRAQDQMAVSMLRHYIDNYEYNYPLEQGDPVLKDLHAHLVALIEWRNNNLDKIKRPDR